MLYLDSETAGFHGPAVLLQWAIDNNPINLHDIFLTSVQDTLDLIEMICSHPEGIVGFNLAYDWFHIQKVYNMLTFLGREVGFQEHPINHVQELAMVEGPARDGECVKPVTALDLMLHARKGPYQSTLDRKEIRIRRLPKVLASQLCGELERRIPIQPIYFSKSKSKQQWKISLIRDPRTNEIDPEFVDCYLRFSPSSALKAIIVDAGLRGADRLLFSDIRPQTQPVEHAYAPVASIITDDHVHWFVQGKDKSGYAWPKLIEDHVYWWKLNEQARTYAAEDVSDLRLLRNHFNNPPPGDDDSILACMVGSIRWRGLSVDIEGVKKLRDEELASIRKAPKAPHKVYQWLSEKMSEDELTAFKDRHGKITTKKTILERIATMKSTCSCVTYETRKEAMGEDESFGGIVFKTIQIPVAIRDCPVCSGTGSILHPAVNRATLVLAARKGVTKIAMYDKLIAAGRLHPAASVIGSLSGRMSGRTEVADGKRSGNINALGIQRDSAIRKVFTMAQPGYMLCGGDFVSYEISIADAMYDDPVLREQLCTCDACKYVCTLDEYQTEVCPKCGGIDSRRKFHGLFAMELNPGMSYTEIIATKNNKDKDLYDQGKRGVFSQLYGGDENTLKERLGIDLDDALRATTALKTRYKGIGRAYQKAFENHCSMRQPGGLGKKVQWFDPKEYVESLTGFRRYFTLENRITKALYTLGEHTPASWLDVKGQVKRRERMQTIVNATRSALFGAAFQVQALCFRAALNHVIQSTGATITKTLQRRIWDLQEPGVSPWMVQPINIHDEVMCPTRPDCVDKVSEIVKDSITEFRKLIPLIKIDWKTGMANWSEK
jgi:hypothetical protein